MRKNGIYIGIIVLALVLLIVLEATLPKPIDWSRNYSKANKAPFGLEIFYQSLENGVAGTTETIAQPAIEKLWQFRYGSDVAAQDILSTQEDLTAQEELIETEESTLREEAQRDLNNLLAGSQNPYANKPHFNYLIISQEANFDAILSEEIVLAAKGGNHFLIAAEQIEGSLPLMFGLEQSYDPYRGLDLNDNSDMVQDIYEDSVRLKLTLNTGARKKENTYTYKIFTVGGVFYKHSPKNARVLVEAEEDGGEVVAIRYTVGEGSILFVASPLLFSNYNMLYEENAELAWQLASWLPKENPTYWDTYLSSRPDTFSRLRYIFATPTLRWAWYLGIAGILLYIFFWGKRKQQAIPVIEPPKNTTVEFVETIGQLYFQRNDNKNIARKRVQFLLEHIRNRYFLSTDYLDKVFMSRLAEKTGIPLKQIKSLFTIIRHIDNRNEISDEELMTLHRLIEDFYQKTNANPLRQKQEKAHTFR